MVATIEQAIAHEGPLEPFLPMASLS